jgi:hypothetical protein
VKTLFVYVIGGSTAGRSFRVSKYQRLRTRAENRGSGIRQRSVPSRDACVMRRNHRMEQVV